MLRSFTSAVLVDFTSFRNQGPRRSGVTLILEVTPALSIDFSDRCAVGDWTGTPRENLQPAIL